jgi:hypothetical protein
MQKMDVRRKYDTSSVQVRGDGRRKGCEGNENERRVEADAGKMCECAYWR